MGCDGADTARPLIWACDIRGFSLFVLLGLAFLSLGLVLVLKLQKVAPSGVAYWLEITADRAADFCCKSLFDPFRYSGRLQDFDDHLPFFANVLLFMLSRCLFPAPQ